MTKYQITNKSKALDFHVFNLIASLLSMKNDEVLICPYVVGELEIRCKIVCRINKTAKTYIVTDH